MTTTQTTRGRSLHTRGERALWAAVLEAVALDARKGKELAYLETADFALVCLLAGIDPDAARTRLRHG